MQEMFFWRWFLFSLCYFKLWVVLPGHTSRPRTNLIVTGISGKKKKNPQWIYIYVACQSIGFYCLKVHCTESLTRSLSLQESLWWADKKTQDELETIRCEHCPRKPHIKATERLLRQADWTQMIAVRISMTLTGHLELKLRTQIILI